MRRVISLAVILSLVSAVGCAPVAANYPKGKVPKEKELPEEYQHRKQSTRLVLREDGAVHAFLLQTAHSSEMVTLMEKYAAMGNQIAANDAKRFGKMAKLELAYAYTRIFLAKGVGKKIKRGDFLITFTDGSSVRDSGAFLYFNSTPKSTRNSTVILNSSSDPEMMGRTLYVFYPAEHLDKTIGTIAISPPKK